MPSWTIDHPDSRTFDPVSRLHVSLESGSVNVLGQEGAPALEVTKINGRPVTAAYEDGTLTINQRSEQFGLPIPSVLSWILTGRRPNAEITVTVPPDCLVEVSVGSGSIMVSNLHEHTRVRGAAGDITLAEVHGTADVRTVSGAIVAEAVTGDLEIRSVSGSITLIAGGGGAVKAATTSGSITVDLDEPEPESIDLSCVSGQLTVRLPCESNVRVDMSATSGTATCDVPEVSVRRQFSMSQLSGVLGDGSGTLRGRTVSGGLTLLRRTSEDGASVHGENGEIDA
jgi:hypothetical protein